MVKGWLDVIGPQGIVGIVLPFGLDRLFDIPPMGGFFPLYIKIERDSRGLFVAQCYPGGGPSLAERGSFMVSSNTLTTD